MIASSSPAVKAVTNGRYGAWKEALLDAAIVAGTAITALLVGVGYEDFAADPPRYLFAVVAVGGGMFFASLKAAFGVRTPKGGG